ncbi:hypothetical protein HBH64_137750 [Parastagonospora nodorum]|nr:hypothetical protein HBH52_130970 [Parastagonospora nodorum]KAH4233139.1 hypothetical protein HBI06_071140 [Parastagonospora nodorum]KAH4246806.1 hypothetical protein HBI05_054360 [Parastagonospora nodorum]KAH4269415.1 hypothetical protein HBI03_047390 [Parastagonospora nodorum]KAH4280021.1 hypothetical protein HBI04_055040 [Parastagonospora nodorum]
MTEHFSNPLRSRKTPCGHELHPAIMKNYSSLYGRQCSCCRMNNAMFDVRRSQDLILGNGGVHTWRDKCRDDKTMKMWERTVRGANRRIGREPIVNIHGEDGSYRASKTRLLNLALKLEELSALERAWEMEQPPETSSPANSPKMRRMQFSATNAMALYNGAVETGIFTKLEEDCKIYMRKRGRDYQASASPEFPDSDSDDEDFKHKFFNANAAQQTFIDTSFPQLADQDTSPPKRKRRRIDASLALNEEVYIRSENDVDALRSYTLGLYADVVEKDSPAPSPPASILRTTPLKIDPRPRRAYRKRGLNKYDGALRYTVRWDRRTKWYQRGAWAVGEESDVVNTSGNGYSDWQWEQYCEALQDEAEEMDLEMEMESGVEKKEIAHEEVEAGQEELGDEGVEVEKEEPNAVEWSIQLPIETVKVKGLAKAIIAFTHARMWR